MHFATSSFPSVLFRHVDRWFNSLSDWNLSTTVLCAFGLWTPAAVTFCWIAGCVVRGWTCCSSQKYTIWVRAVSISLFQSLASTMKPWLHWELQKSRCDAIKSQICKICCKNVLFRLSIIFIRCTNKNIEQVKIQYLTSSFISRRIYDFFQQTKLWLNISLLFHDEPFSPWFPQYGNYDNVRMKKKHWRHGNTDCIKE